MTNTRFFGQGCTYKVRVSLSHTHPFPKFLANLEPTQNVPVDFFAHGKGRDSPLSLVVCSRRLAGSGNVPSQIDRWVLSLFSLFFNIYKTKTHKIKTLNSLSLRLLLPDLGSYIVWISVRIRNGRKTRPQITHWSNGIPHLR